MKLAEQVLAIHEDVKTAETIIKSYLNKPNPKSHAVEDFFFDTDCKNLVGDENTDQLDKWEVDLQAENFSESLLQMCEGEDVTAEDCKELASKIPSMIKGKQFQIDSVTGKVSDSRGNHRSKANVSKIVVEVKSAKYDDNKDVLTAEVKITDVDMR
jgi:hypothetical protein